MKKKFNVHYSFYLSDSIEIEAKNEAEAEAKVNDMIECGELAQDLNRVGCADTKIWVD